MSLTELERLVRTGQYTQAMNVFAELLQEPDLKRQDLAYAYHCASVARYKTGQVFSAKEFASLAEENARAAGDMLLLGRIWINQIGIYFDAGDLALALDYGERWLAERNAYPELADQEARVHYNLALVQRGRRNQQRSHQHFQAALDLARVRGLSAAFRVQVMQQYAWYLYWDGRVEEADGYVAQAGELVDEDDVEGVREQLLLKGLRAFQTGGGSEAMNIAREFAAPGAPATQRQKFWAYYLAGRVACINRHHDAAKALAALAMDIAVESRISEYINRANELKRLAHQAQGETTTEAAG